MESKGSLHHDQLLFTTQGKLHDCTKYLQEFILLSHEVT